MSNAMVVITEKVVRMVRSMVYLSLRMEHRDGATCEEISKSLNRWAETRDVGFHDGVVERALAELRGAGLVDRSGQHWYPAGVRA